MSRPLDHLVLPCRDLAAAAQRFTDLGFIVGRRNRHPWGTENHIIQFDGVFLELIALAADAVPPAPEDDAFPFAGFLAGRGSSTDPSGMVVLRSAHATADAAAFARAGIGEGRTLFFARDAAGPDDRLRTVSFTHGFAAAPTMPDVGFFVCQQHAPENFWNPTFQRHVNGVTGVAAVTLVSDDPQQHAAFLVGFADQNVVEQTASGIALDLGNSLIEVIDPAAGRARFGGADGAGAARLAALRFKLRAPTNAPRRVHLDGLPHLQFG